MVAGTKRMPEGTDTPHTAATGGTRTCLARPTASSTGRGTPHGASARSAPPKAQADFFLPAAAQPAACAPVARPGVAPAAPGPWPRERTPHAPPMHPAKPACFQIYCRGALWNRSEHRAACAGSCTAAPGCWRRRLVCGRLDGSGSAQPILHAGFCVATARCATHARCSATCASRCARACVPRGWAAARGCRRRSRSVLTRSVLPWQKARARARPPDPPSACSPQSPRGRACGAARARSMPCTASPAQ